MFAKVEELVIQAQRCLVEKRMNPQESQLNMARENADTIWSDPVIHKELLLFVKADGSLIFYAQKLCGLEDFCGRICALISVSTFKC